MSGGEALFKQVSYTLDFLVNSIEMGQIGLPDIQRPFVWKNAKIRDLFDSMYRGYPVGYLLFWENAYTQDARAIGVGQKQKMPNLLIVDGQQRLTSLFAVVKGVPVIRDNYEPEIVEVAFNPLTEQFAVADAAIRRDKAYIANISEIWSGDTSLFGAVKGYLTELAATREVTPDEQAIIEGSIQRLYNLIKYPFTALELSRTIDEEQVAEVFVRINSKGKPLNQADFILTLMSVFWDEGRSQLEDFCRRSRKPSTGEASPYNHYIQPDPDQLLRVAVGLGFKRARLQYVYSILRGKDLETETFSAERREEQFKVLQDAQAKVLDLKHWHDFYKAIATAGFLGGRLISSNNNLIFAYVLYLIGRTEYKVDELTLRRVIARWFFMSSLTGRYTGSPESALESDLARLRDVSSAAGFVSILDRVCDANLTSDFWSITLPNELATSSPMSPSLFAYYAALVLLDARALFSDQKVRAMLDPSVHGTRSAVERHHLFPKAHLATQGITEIRDTNQIANFALVEWGDNGAIGGSPPAEYVPVMHERFAGSALREMYEPHALADGWESMDYRAFLEDRRERMAKIIERAFATLREKGGATQSSLSLDELIDTGETTTTEFKAALRHNLHTGQADPRIEHAVLKTIAGFLNTHGGLLFIGITDDGTPVGIKHDGFQNEDRMSLHLVNLIKARLGPQTMMYIHPRFEDLDGIQVMVVECSGMNSPVYLKDGNSEQFFIRTGPSTAELKPSEIQAYIKQRFG